MHEGKSFVHDCNFLDGCVDCNSATSHMNCLYLYSFSRKIIQDGIFVRFFKGFHPFVKRESSRPLKSKCERTQLMGFYC